MLRFRLLAVFAVLAATLAACGDDERNGDVEVSGSGTTGTETTGTTTDGGGATGAVVATVAVAETEYRLDPQGPQVEQAGVVRFKVRNAGKIVHALEVEGPSGEQETKPIKPGGSATLKIDLGKAGRYEWYCPIGDHKERGMKGEIAVAGGGPAKPEGNAKTATEDAGGGSDGHGGY